MSIVESYRAAAAKLEQACVQPAGYGRGSLVGAAAALVSGQIARVLLTMEIEPWLLQAARLRLLLEALLAEQEERRELVGHGYRDCLRDDGSCAGCGAVLGARHQGICDWERCAMCRTQRMCCDCEDEEIVALVREVLKGAGHE